jgi:hypothetical protein
MSGHIPASVIRVSYSGIQPGRSEIGPHFAVKGLSLEFRDAADLAIRAMQYFFFFKDHLFIQLQ